MSSPPAPTVAPPSRCDLAVVGAGIVGLAVAREMARRHPALSVCVLERERDIATHQTAHSSGVVHAGIYYQPGSLKARLCLQGARELYAYCEQRGIAYRRSGKLIVAIEPGEIAGLDELERRGRTNGVAGLRRLGAAELREIEPHARGLAALHSPATGVADFAALARAFARDMSDGGGCVSTACGVSAVRSGGRSVMLSHARGELEAGHVICCAGAWSDRLAVACGEDPDPRIVPFRGAYLRLASSARWLVRSLIYPVPDPSLPFLGIHLTRTVDDEVLIGPTALLAGARDAYSLRRVRPRDLVSTLAWPGTWRMGRRWWRTGMSELHHVLAQHSLVREAQRFVPELSPDDVSFAFAGVRAQALGRDGRLVDDFAFSGAGRVLHVRNAPSPAATSSLAIAQLIAERAEAQFGLAA